MGMRLPNDENWFARQAIQFMERQTNLPQWVPVPHRQNLGYDKVLYLASQP